VRIPTTELSNLEFGDLKILPDQGQVIVDKKAIHLTRTEFQLLIELASAPGRVFSRDELLERVWGRGYFGDGRLVDVHIRRLRKKIEPEDAKPRYVITVRGFGYKLQG
jgi:DNA-binding response OmpR family regulator